MSQQMRSPLSAEISLRKRESFREFQSEHFGGGEGFSRLENDFGFESEIPDNPFEMMDSG